MFIQKFLSSSKVKNLSVCLFWQSDHIILSIFREPELVLLDMQSVPAGQEGWLAFDVTTASNHWLLHPRSNLGIRLYVETEEGGSTRHNRTLH